jgi:hypothetical protein
VDKPGFREFLKERDVPEAEIEDAITLAKRFEAFLQGEESTGLSKPAAVQAFSSVLIQEELNTWANYVTLARYGRFVNDDSIYVAIVELLDGSEALEGLHRKLAERLGERKRDEIFEGIELPPLGTPTAQRPSTAQAVMERLEELVEPDTCQEILSGGLRHLEDEWFLDQRAKYKACASIDEYLEKKGQDFIAELEELEREGKLFFTQRITREVIDYVRSHPEIASGVLEGNTLYEVKIPYMTREYLAETDERMKRYYYCHCPWVRESLRAGDLRVSPAFCQCSAGFHKKSWEVILGQSLEAEVVESVLQGDMWCKIAIQLPEQAQEQKA